ncbi:carbohydrate ABC transporter permease [uncultured Sphaerochaeta sp.]|uniref:carbohydrate ABC transporter permease n=1 Tax=uncultured Sphaerochaeta sp. TaxID=886478 RepID=UPI002A0A25AC|nr:carbohydrate ABC transporter permease [uncultured Sphaerochaeta sp.]
MKIKRSAATIIGEVSALILTFLTHWVVFYFIIINSFKTRAEAARLSLAFPKKWQIIENYSYILSYGDGLFFRSMWNSIRLTIISIVILVLVASMTGYIMQRRQGKFSKISNKLILAGLIVPPSVISTYWILSQLGVVGTLAGLTLVEVATMFPFSVMIYKGYMATIPRDIDAAAIIDGCSASRLYFQIIFPILKPITATIVILRSVVVYNDFANPLYYMSGARNSTIQLFVYTFQSAFLTQWNYLFAAIVLISLPPFILYLILNKRILEGVTAGAVKG